jgi:hypothetical protein
MRWKPEGFRRTSTREEGEQSWKLAIGPPVQGQRIRVCLQGTLPKPES